MTILSAQSIRHLATHPKRPLISPFEKRQLKNGKTFGLGPATYDVRSAQRMEIVPYWQSHTGYLLSTMERFILPPNIIMEVHDKSTGARHFITVFNTIADPGWEGYLTLELVNLGAESYFIDKGDPVAQMKFSWLDDITEAPYRGKYQGQPNKPVGAILE